jgi:hypothetical protein
MRGIISDAGERHVLTVTGEKKLKGAGWTMQEMDRVVG